MSEAQNKAAKSQVDQLKGLTEKVQKQLDKQVNVARNEASKILSELGVDLKAEGGIDMDAVIKSVREKNPTLKQFIRNLDVATYNARWELSWNSKMIPAFSRLQAKKTYNKEFRPKVEELRAKVQERLNELNERTQETRKKFFSSET